MTDATLPFQGPPRPAAEKESVYLYRLDQETKLPVVVGKVFVDKNNDAWVRIDADELASGINVENIDGVMLLDHNTYNALETE